MFRRECGASAPIWQRTYDLARCCIAAGSIEAVTAAVSVSRLPSRHLGELERRHTIARFPGAGEPRNVFEKLKTAPSSNALCGVSHLLAASPWDKTDDLPG